MTKCMSPSPAGTCLSRPRPRPSPRSPPRPLTRSPEGLPFPTESGHGSCCEGQTGPPTGSLHALLPRPCSGLCAGSESRVASFSSFTSLPQAEWGGLGGVANGL